MTSDNSKLRAFGESPKLTAPDFLDKLIFETHIEHSELLAKAEGKVDNPAIEYADLLFRRYHQKLIRQLLEAGINL